jgi:predicted dehydrogenase
MVRLRLGVVGVGHLGKEHARILAGMPDVTLVGVADPNASQAESVALRCGTRAYSDYRPLLEAVDAAVIAAPTAHHHAIACDFLRRGVPLLVEKPLTAELGQADELVSLASRQQVLLQAGHIERFNPAFEELQRHPLRPKYISCERCSGFTGRSTDIGVVLDLMIHDLDLVLALVRAPVTSVWAMGVAVLGGHEDLARARVTFADGCVADLCASRVHPAPVRCMQIWSAEGYASVDFARRHLTLTQPSDSLRQGRIDSRRLDAATASSLKAELFTRYIQVQEIDCAGGDQLTAELQEFVGSVHGDGAPRVSGTAGRDAVGLATRVLAELRGHEWEAKATGPIGPNQIPAPAGTLFMPPAREAAA